jgi:hypothetical protein
MSTGLAGDSWTDPLLAARSWASLMASAQVWISHRVGSILLTISLCRQTVDAATTTEQTFQITAMTQNKSCQHSKIPFPAQLFLWAAYLFRIFEL